MTNPNNFPGATVTVVGWIANDPEYPPYDKEGKRGFKRFSVPVREGYKKDGEFKETGTTWYEVTLHEDKIDELSDNGIHLVKGAKVRIEDAKQEVREYKNKNGEEKLGITLSYGNINVIEYPDGFDEGDVEDDDLPF